MKKGWAEINTGADIKVPIFFKFIIKYVTPILLGWVFINSIPDIVSTLKHDKSKEKIAFYQNTSAMKAKSAEQQSLLLKKSDFKPEYLNTKAVSDDQLMKNKQLTVPTYLLIKKERELGKILSETSYKTEKIESENKTMLYKNISRVFLLILWLGIAYLVYIASRKIKLKES
jgi:antitoxin component YwqK of YwqJK toxin-antitoxin module